jgi:hypothetical protein
MELTAEMRSPTWLLLGCFLRQHQAVSGVLLLSRCADRAEEAQEENSNRSGKHPHNRGAQLSSQSKRRDPGQAMPLRVIIGH